MNVAVTRSGRPDAESDTALLKFVLVMLMSTVVLAPRVTLFDDGVELSVNVPADVTVSVTVVECDRLPLVPVMVKG